VSPCLIATASFGSSSAPEVQLLRNFRDNQVMPTFAGSMFMSVFNSWYYSFSPNVALYENSHPTARNAIRMSLYPLIMILRLGSMTFSELGMIPELAAFTTGILTSFLVGFTYLSLPSYLILNAFKRRVTIRAAKTVKLWLTGSFVISIAIFIVSEVFTINTSMMVATTGLALSALAFGAIFPALTTFERLRRDTRS